jgi:hypothetical protein
MKYLAAICGWWLRLIGRPPTVTAHYVGSNNAILEWCSIRRWLPPACCCMSRGRQFACYLKCWRDLVVDNKTYHSTLKLDKVSVLKWTNVLSILSDGGCIRFFYGCTSRTWKGWKLSSFELQMVDLQNTFDLFKVQLQVTRRLWMDCKQHKHCTLSFIKCGLKCACVYVCDCLRARTYVFIFSSLLSP